MSVGEEVAVFEAAYRRCLPVMLKGPGGIDVLGIVLDPAGHGAGDAVFRRSNHLALRRIEDLPSRVSERYFRLARR